jgi:hypothetical protein
MREVPLHGERTLASAARCGSTWSACTGAGPARSTSARARSRTLERVAASRARGGGPARPALRGRAALAPRQSVLGRAVGPDRVPPARAGHAPARLLRPERGGASPLAARRHDRVTAADRPRGRGARTRAIRRAAPSFARTLQFAVVHHTAGTNSYTSSQSAAIVRGIEVYHVKGNG